MTKREAWSCLAYVCLSAVIIWSIVSGLSPLLYVAIAVIALIAVTQEPLVGLGLTLGLTMLFERFFTLASLSFDGNIYKIYPLDIVIGITILGAIAHIVQRRLAPIRWELPEKLLSLFIITALVHFLFSLMEFSSDSAVVFSTFKYYALYPLLYFLTVALVNNRDALAYMIKTIIGAGMGIIIFIIIGVWNGAGLWTEFTPLSTDGTRLLAGTHGFYLTLASLIVFSYLAYRRWRRPIWGWVLIAIWSFGILASLMRHLWIAEAIALIVMFVIVPLAAKKQLLTGSLKLLLVALGGIILTLWFVALSHNQLLANTGEIAAVFTQRVSSITNTFEDTSASWRLSLWQDAYTAWRAHPFVGIGFGQSLLLDTGDWQTFEEIRNIHNSPLAILVQMGLIGISFLGAFVLVLLMWTYRVLRNQELAPIAVGLFAGLLLIGVSSLFQPYLETNLTAICLWIWLGLLRAISILDQQHDHPSRQ